MEFPGGSEHGDDELPREEQILQFSRKIQNMDTRAKYRLLKKNEQNFLEVIIRNI